MRCAVHREVREVDCGMCFYLETLSNPGRAKCAGRISVRIAGVGTLSGLRVISREERRRLMRFNED